MSGVRARRGGLARRRGRRAEVFAAFWLMAKGYRILGFRLKTPQGEIDLLACKGRTLAVVEVKQRVNLDAALEAVGPVQRERLRRAAAQIAARRRGLSDLRVRLDLIAFAPLSWPRHLADAWKEDSDLK